MGTWRFFASSCVKVTGDRGESSRGTGRHHFVIRTGGGTNSNLVNLVLPISQLWIVIWFLGMKWREGGVRGVNELYYRRYRCYSGFDRGSNDIMSEFILRIPVYLLTLYNDRLQGTLELEHLLVLPQSSELIFREYQSVFYSSDLFFCGTQCRGGEASPHEPRVSVRLQGH